MLFLLLCILPLAASIALSIALERFFPADFSHFVPTAALTTWSLCAAEQLFGLRIRLLFATCAALACLVCARSLLRSARASILSFGPTPVSVCGAAIALLDIAASSLHFVANRFEAFPVAPYLAFGAFWFSCSVFALDRYAAHHRSLSKHKEYDYLIVPGAALSGNAPSPYLSERLDACIELWKTQSEKAAIIVSGGKGSDEVVSESQAMKNYLKQHGVPSNLILQEDISTSTQENFIYTREAIDRVWGRAEEPVLAVISTDYHLPRCHAYAKRAGMRVDTYGASSAGARWQRGYIREVIALTRMLLPTYAVPAIICTVMPLIASL